MSNENNQAQLEMSGEEPEFYPGLLISFFHELEGEKLELLLDECREVLAINLARGVSSGKRPDINSEMEREAELLRVLTHEFITGGIQPPPD
jgi:hypothetical protein